MDEVRIHYLRPPDREQVFRQLLVEDRPDVKVTLARETSLDRPLVIGGEVALEDGSDVVWFTFPGAWHDIGRFHRADGRLTGLYANVLTPPELDLGGRSVRIWRTTDLFLDVWIPPGGGARLLDREQLDEAEAEGWVESETAERARLEAERLLEGFRAGTWPPSVVDEWTRERALEAAAGAGPGGGGRRAARP